MSHRLYPLGRALASPTGWDVALVEFAFLSMLSPAISYIILREWRLWKEERRRAQAEAEAIAAEGFPPPDPPTTDSLSS